MTGTKHQSNNKEKRLQVITSVIPLDATRNLRQF